MRLSAVLAGVCLASSATAQDTHLHFYITYEGPSEWLLWAELENPTGNVLATVSDLGFTLAGSNISNFEYNSAFDSTFFGDADVSVTSDRVDFRGGNTLPPLNNPGGPDSSNPLEIATFRADVIDSFDLVGQVTGAYVSSPFPEIIIFQNADGSPGETPWCYFSLCTPTPGTAVMLGIASSFAARRRR